MVFKIAYANTINGFQIPIEAVLLGRQISGSERWGNCILKGELTQSLRKSDIDYLFPDIPRHDKILIEVLEKTLAETLYDNSLFGIKIRKIESNLYRIHQLECGIEEVIIPKEEKYITIIEEIDQTNRHIYQPDRSKQNNRPDLL